MRVTSTFHLLAPLLLASACARPAAQQPYDLLITGGSVLNGEGTPAVRADVGIRGGRIAAIGDLQTATAARRIEASGLTVAPGFIDMHNLSATKAKACSAPPTRRFKSARARRSRSKSST